MSAVQGGICLCLKERQSPGSCKPQVLSELLAVPIGKSGAADAVVIYSGIAVIHFGEIVHLQGGNRGKSRNKMV